MKVLLTGASGMIGTALQRAFPGFEYRVLSRKTPPPEGTFLWQPEKNVLDINALEGADAIVHLAGPGIADSRWTPKRKKTLLEARVNCLQTLENALENVKTLPKTLIIASAVGWYDKENSDLKTETYPNGTGFDAHLCHTIETTLDAEKFAQKYSSIRLIYLRFGIVLSPTGGALKRLLLPFRLGLGGKLGTGQQPFPWVSLTDAARAITYCLEKEKMQGAVNVVAPAQDTNASFTTTLGKVLKRPTFVPVPAPVLKLALGEMGEELLLTGTHVAPKALLDNGFSFTHNTLEEALQAELGRK